MIVNACRSKADIMPSRLAAQGIAGEGLFGEGCSLRLFLEVRGTCGPSAQSIASRLMRRGATLRRKPFQKLFDHD